MFGRHDPAGGVPLRRDRRLNAYLRREVEAYAGFWRSATPGGLDRVPARSMADLAPHAAELVLRPDVASVYRSGRRRLALRTAWSRLWGRQQKVNDKVLVPYYKPVLWTLSGAIPIGSSEADVDRLARIGARWLADAGVRRDDVVVNLLPTTPPNLPWWQTVVGCRRLRVSAVHVGRDVDPAEVDRLQPTVLVGQPMDLLRLLPRVATPPRLVLAVGRPLDDGLRARIAAAADDAPVLSAWAPPGVRAMWAECKGGEPTGLHTWPGSEVVELADPLTGNAAPPGAGGEVVWSAFGWRGTVMLRLRTGVFATLDGGRCPTCGRDAPRLSVSGGPPRFFDVLDRHPDVTGWQAELRTVDGLEELLVFLATDRSERLDALLHELDGVLSVTQFVVLPRDELDRRVAAHDDSRVLDLRPS